MHTCPRAGPDAPLQAMLGSAGYSLHGCISFALQSHLPGCIHSIHPLTLVSNLYRHMAASLSCDACVVSSKSSQHRCCLCVSTSESTTHLGSCREATANAQASAISRQALGRVPGKGPVGPLQEAQHLKDRIAGACIKQGAIRFCDHAPRHACQN